MPDVDLLHGYSKRRYLARREWNPSLQKKPLVIVIGDGRKPGQANKPKKLRILNRCSDFHPSRNGLLHNLNVDLSLFSDGRLNQSNKMQPTEAGFRFPICMI
eukprot:TRINITY_DN15567_c0_g1_i1.p1 TRINITY_DN15567_c0_g1~~TRINITY_DN15567_c0_g1_i1.p1  ORF type:complete len:102 (+),score=8.20 TRINITY_DN15567_c0_g1_i1:375-680(+)